MLTRDQCGADFIATILPQTAAINNRAINVCASFKLRYDYAGPARLLWSMFIKYTWLSSDLELVKQLGRHFVDIRTTIDKGILFYLLRLDNKRQKSITYWVIRPNLIRRIWEHSVRSSNFEILKIFALMKRLLICMSTETVQVVKNKVEDSA